MQSEASGQPNPAGSYVESTIIVQYDPQVQEVFDQARKLRCTWYDYYEKSVTFRPFQVGTLLHWEGEIYKTKLVNMLQNAN